MELSLDTEWIIFQIAQDMNAYFKRLIVYMYLEITHLYRRTPIDEG